MILIQDRDLVAIEPHLFRDIVFEPQVLARRDDAEIANGSLSSASSDFAAAGIDTGHIVQAGRSTLEVIERVSATELSVSLPRTSTEDPVRAIDLGIDQPIRVCSFVPQIQLAQDWLYRAHGINPEHTIVHSPASARIVGLRSLHLIFTAASAATDTDPNWTRAQWYAERSTTELRRATILIDTDNGGSAYHEQRPQPTRMVRE